MMYATELLDSMRFRLALDHLAACWRSKRAGQKEKEDALQKMLDMIPERQGVALRIQDKPVPKAESIPNKSELTPQDMRELPPADMERIFDLAPKAPEEMAKEAQEQADGRREAVLKILESSSIPKGQIGYITLPDHIPAVYMPDYLQGTDYDVTGEPPMPWAAMKHISRFNGKQAPTAGWRVQVRRK